VFGKGNEGEAICDHQIKVAPEVATAGETLIVNFPQHTDRKPPYLGPVFQVID
jgi:hypothetical protein